MLLFQVGIVIIVLFDLIMIMIGNMFLNASFASSLMLTYYYSQETLSEFYGYWDDYKFLSWATKYWTEHSEEMYPLSEEEMFENSGQETKSEPRCEEILLRLQKADCKEITAKEARSLSDDGQRLLALYLYQIIYQYLYTNYYQLFSYVNMDFLCLNEETGGIYTLFGISQEPGKTFHPALTSDEEEMQKDMKLFSKVTEGSVYHSILPPSRKEKFNIYFRGYSEGTQNLIFRLTVRGEEVAASMDQAYVIRYRGIALLFLAVVIVLFWLYLKAVKPLSLVNLYVKEYSQDKDALRAQANLSKIRSGNEIGLLAGNFSALAMEMDRYTKENALLERENARVSTEIMIATEIQSSMVPHNFPDRKEFRLYASMSPAREVGGDFYDFYFIDEDHLALTIADVSGKGIPAALFMAYSKAILREHALRGGTPGQILHEVNNQLSQDNDTAVFATVWLGILTLSTGALVYANAGHDDPFLRLGQSSFRIRKGKHGIMLGLMEDTEYPEETCRLGKGDALFLYTDGITEASAKDGSLFTEKRLNLVLKSTDASSSPEQIILSVLDAVHGFAAGAPQYDDITMLSLVYFGTDT